MNKKYLIIAGSEKSGTTSLYQYLIDTQSFNQSRKKETDYFRNTQNLSETNYIEEFALNSSEKPFLEASPGYLSDSEIAAINIAKTITSYHLVFCLRNPIDRFISSFDFRKSRLYIPKEMEIEEYFEHCLEYDATGNIPEKLNDWSVKVLDTGKYGKHLSNFEIHCKDNYSVFSFEKIVMNPRDVINKIFAKMEMDNNFDDNYVFHKNNVTTSYKHAKIQAIALKTNSIMEPIFFRYPKIKRTLLKAYKSLNSSTDGKTMIDDKFRSRLQDYYRDDIKSLNDMGFSEITDSWGIK